MRSFDKLRMTGFFDGALRRMTFGSTGGLETIVFILVQDSGGGFRGTCYTRHLTRSACHRSAFARRAYGGCFARPIACGRCVRRVRGNTWAGEMVAAPVGELRSLV